MGAWLLVGAWLLIGGILSPIIILTVKDREQRREEIAREQGFTPHYHALVRPSQPHTDPRMSLPTSDRPRSSGDVDS